MSFRDVPTSGDALKQFLQKLSDDVRRLQNGGAIKGDISLAPQFRMGDVIVTVAGGDGGPDDTARTLTFTNALTGDVVAPATPPPAPAAATYITGQVDAAATGPAGSGFSVVKSATGVYDITFATAFAALPTVVATPGPAGVIRIAVLTAATTSTAQISTFNTGGTPIDAAFNFVAYATA